MAKVITGKVRFSYVHVFEPEAIDESSEKKYSVSIIIPKSDKETIEKINKAIQTAIEEGTPKFGGKATKAIKTPMRDGDTERDEEAYKNSMFLSAKSGQRPGLVDKELQPIIDPQEFYSGCYGRASLSFYPFNVNGNKGIACGLNNLQKLEDGEKLGGGSSAIEDFGEGSDDLM